MRVHRFTTRYLIEITIFFVVCVGIGQTVYPDEPGFYGWTLNPLWIGVLLFSLRYGFATGFVSGIFAAGVYISLCYYAKDDGQFILDRYLFAEPDFYVLPSLFLAFGAVVGWVVSSLENTASIHMDERDSLIKNAAPMQKELKTLHEINLALEKKVVTQMATLVTMYEGARLLENQNLDEILAAVTRFFSKVLGVEEATLYLLKDGKWSLKESFALTETPHQDLSIVHDMVKLAAERRKIISLRDYIKDQQIETYTGDCLVAGPLLDGEKGQVIGVYSIRKIPLGSLNSSLINALNLLLGWTSRAINKAKQIHALKENAIIDTRFGIFSRSYFLGRCEEEFGRSKKYYLPLSFARIEVAGLESFSAERRENWLISIVRILKQSFREMDVIGLLREEKIQFGVLMVTCPPGLAEEMVQQAMATYQQLGLGGDIKLDIQVSHFQPKMTSFEDMHAGE